MPIEFGVDFTNMYIQDVTVEAHVLHVRLVDSELNSSYGMSHLTIIGIYIDVAVLDLRNCHMVFAPKFLKCNCCACMALGIIML